MLSLRNGCTAMMLASVLLLAGCATVPQSIRGISPEPQQDLVRVMNAPQLFVGQESRFGGQVVKVTNNNGMTRIELAVQPLDDSARPVLGSASIGRIYADVHGFVDPVNLNNQYLTVLGNIRGTEKGQIGQASYNFLVIDVTGYQRWHLSTQVMSPPMPMDPWIWYGPGPGRYRHGYWGNPWWGFYSPGPAQVQTFLTE